MKNDWMSNEPWYENDDFAKLVVDKVPILDIISRCGLECFGAQSGNFSHKTKCPFHLNGNERTASLYVSEANNSFHCFACNSGGSVIDFIMLYKGMPYYGALEFLAKAYRLTNVSEEELEKISIEHKPINPEHTITPYIYHTGILLREHLKTLGPNENIVKWKRWTEYQFKKLDHYIENYDDSRWEEVKKNQEKIINFIQNGKI